MKSPTWNVYLVLIVAALGVGFSIAVWKENPIAAQILGVIGIVVAALTNSRNPPPPPDPPTPPATGGPKTGPSPPADMYGIEDTLPSHRAPVFVIEAPQLPWWTRAWRVVGFFAFFGIGFILAIVPGCALLKSPGGHTAILSAETIACALASGLQPDDPNIKAVCAITDELVPDLLRIFAAQRTGMARAAARRPFRDAYSDSDAGPGF